MRKLLLLGAMAATLGSSAMAAVSTSCIRHDDIYNWTALNDKAVVLENNRHQKVLLTLIGTCSDLKFHEVLAIGGRGESGLSCVQPGDTVTTRNSGLGGRCAVVAVAPYTGDTNAHGHPDDRDHHDHDNY